nr:immunoglobulin heavy chain junction region [Mus musculus]MBK4186823.1 immunoglobulin heavy chain junction region [Mus musculus]
CARLWLRKGLDVW